MKRLFLFLLSILFISSFTNAQEDDCMAFFPTTPGTALVTSNYDASDNLLSTMTYRIDESYDYLDGTDMQMSFTFMDNTGTVRGTGKLNADCNDGFFSMKMNIVDADPFLMDALAHDTELVGNFLDYPNSFNELDDPFSISPFGMSGGEYTIKSKDKNAGDIRVRVYERSYEKDEKINTIAGSFNAFKISFMYDVTRDGKTVTYKGIEWFAPNTGIVKTETYDNKGNMVSHSELTVLKKG